MPEEIRQMLDAATPKAVKRLIDALDATRPVVVGNGPHATVEMHPDYEMQVKAANAILDRRYGKPAQAVTGDEGNPLRVGIVVLPLEEP